MQGVFTLNFISLRCKLQEMSLLIFCDSVFSTRFNKMSDIEDLKIPLIVGVSGHIDIAEPEEAFEKPLKEFWTLLRERVGSETPIILLSSLAVGADRLAAKYRPADVKLCAVLPFERQAYEKDFSGEELDAFRAFMADSFKCITCPGAPGDYAAGSDYIRSRADVMLTFLEGW